MNFRIFVFCNWIINFCPDIGFNAEQDSKDIYISDQELTSLLSAKYKLEGLQAMKRSLVLLITCKKNFIPLLQFRSRIGLLKISSKNYLLKQETIPDEPSEEELERFLNKIKMITMFHNLLFSHHYFSKESDAKESCKSF